MKDEDWISDDERRDIQRRTWNRLERDIENPSPAVKRFSNISSLLIMSAIVLVLVCAGVRVALGLLGIWPL